MSVEDKVNSNLVSEEERLHVECRYQRKVKGVCPAQKYNHRGVAYCTRLASCEQFGCNELVYDVGSDKKYQKCTYISRYKSMILEWFMKSGDKK